WSVGTTRYRLGTPPTGAVTRPACLGAAAGCPDCVQGVDRAGGRCGRAKSTPASLLGIPRTLEAPGEPLDHVMQRLAMYGCRDAAIHGLDLRGRVLQGLPEPFLNIRGDVVRTMTRPG